MTISGKLLHSIDQKKEEQSDFKQVVAATLVRSSVFFLSDSSAIVAGTLPTTTNILNNKNKT